MKRLTLTPMTKVSVTYSGVPLIQPGDRITIDGIYKRIPNPDREWWRFWKPMTVPGEELKEFECITVGAPKK